MIQETLRERAVQITAYEDYLAVIANSKNKIPKNKGK